MTDRKVFTVHAMRAYVGIFALLRTSRRVDVADWMAAKNFKILIHLHTTTTIKIPINIFARAAHLNDATAAALSTRFIYVVNLNNQHNYTVI